jgi:hypothetical protein
MTMHFTEALGSYREAAGTLYDADERQVEQPARELLVHSQEVERAGAAGLAAGDADVRELAAVQLAAGAALDLAMAADLLTRTDALSRGEVAERLAVDDAEGSAVTWTYDQLDALLAASPALGMRTLIDDEKKGVTASGGAPAALESLRDAATKAIADIEEDATAIAQDCVERLLDLPAAALLGAADGGADKLLGPVYSAAKGQVKRVARIAIKFVMKAVSKLLRVMGPFEDGARAWLVKKLGGLTKGALTAFVVGHALQIDAIRDSVEGKIGEAEQAPDKVVPDRLETASGELSSLSSRFAKHRKVIDLLTKLLGKVSGAILRLATWAAVALAGVFVLILCYGIWVAGDYLDWFRAKSEGRLDFVDGVRAIVSQALVGVVAPTAP